jgi:hypothetical protein
VTVGASAAALSPGTAPEVPISVPGGAMAAPRAGHPVRSVATVAPHVFMVGIMAAAMFGPEPILGSLAGAALLIVASICCAPVARRSPVFRAHVVDFWAMALALLILLPHGVGAGAAPAAAGHGATSAGMSMPMGSTMAPHDGAALGFTVLLVAWAAVRLLVGRFSTHRLHDAVTAVITASGLVVMLAI